MSKENQNKPGYKHTPLGWIPEEWKVKHLEEISGIDKSCLNGDTPPDYFF